MSDEQQFKVGDRVLLLPVSHEGWREWSDVKILEKFIGTEAVISGFVEWPKGFPNAKLEQTTSMYSNWSWPISDLCRITSDGPCKIAHVPSARFVDLKARVEGKVAPSLTPASTMAARDLEIEQLARKMADDRIDAMAASVLEAGDGACIPTMKDRFLQQVAKKPELKAEPLVPKYDPDVAWVADRREALKDPLRMTATDRAMMEARIDRLVRDQSRSSNAATLARLEICAKDRVRLSMIYADLIGRKLVLSFKGVPIDWDSGTFYERNPKHAPKGTV